MRENRGVKKRKGTKKLLRGLVPRRRKERRNAELWAAAAASALVISIFLASSIDRYLIRSEQYASVVAAVLVDMANGDRAGKSLPALTVNPLLVAAAQKKADDMAAFGYFAHVSPAGVEPWHWFKEAGYSFQYAGENLAIDFSDSADVNTAWMNSPTHRQNILDPHFTEIGIATAQGMYEGRMTTFVVQEFGAPAPSGAAQEPLAAAVLPEDPAQPALASATGAAVLGETAAPKTPKEVPAPAGAAEPEEAQPSAPAFDESPESPSPAAAATAAPAPDYAPWWAHLAASPRQAMEYAYWVLALLILLALAAATGFEIHWHHRHKAMAAGFVLALMCGIFLLGGAAVFPAPELPSSASMTASAAAAR